MWMVVVVVVVVVVVAAAVAVVLSRTKSFQQFHAVANLLICWLH